VIHVSDEDVERVLAPRDVLPVHIAVAGLAYERVRAGG